MVAALMNDAETVPDAWACTTERLEADVCTLAGQLSAATCRWLLLIAELDRRKAYERPGASRRTGLPSTSHRDRGPEAVAA